MKKILVVDDTPSMGDVLRKALKDLEPKYKHTRTMSQYTIDLERDQFIAITDMDFKHEEERDWDNTLFHHLEKIKGIFEIDYNGHFGSVIFVNIETEHDTPETWKTIEDTIDSYLETK